MHVVCLYCVYVCNIYAYCVFILCVVCLSFMYIHGPSLRYICVYTYVYIHVCILGQSFRHIRIYIYVNTLTFL